METIHWHGKCRNHTTSICTISSDDCWLEYFTTCEYKWTVSLCKGAWYHWLSLTVHNGLVGPEYTDTNRWFLSWHTREGYGFLHWHSQCGCLSQRVVHPFPFLELYSVDRWSSYSYHCLPFWTDSIKLEWCWYKWRGFIVKIMQLMGGLPIHSNATFLNWFSNIRCWYKWRGFVVEMTYWAQGRSDCCSCSIL